MMEKITRLETKARMSETPHILVVDDHREIRDLLAKYLEQHGLRVTTASDAADARRKLKAAAIDLAIVDVMMPGEDGLSLSRDLRATTDLPIIMLTALAEETDRIVGLETGADDYVTKPFSPREVLARIKAVLRRAHSLPPRREPADEEKLTFAGWTLDVRRRELIDPSGVALPLSATEFALLGAFVHHPGMVLSRDQLLDLTKGKAADVFDRSIDNQVSRLRRKIEIDPKKPEIIKTVWGGGYMFTPKVEHGA